MRPRGMTASQLSTWRDPATEVAVHVRRWLYSEAITDQFIEHPHSVWLLWNYFRKVGARAVVRKVRSRLAEEKARNAKLFGVGIGTVTEAPDRSRLTVGQEVVFLAYNHSPTAEIICLREEFVCPVEEFGQRGMGSAGHEDASASLAPVRAYVGWSPYSGIPVCADRIRGALAGVRQTIVPEDTDGGSGPTTHAPARLEQLNVTPAKEDRPSAVLFGLGNYAKTTILPNIRPYVDVQRVHEVDPGQLAFLGDRPSMSLDTSPYPRPDLRFDAWFIAGYHHTHADLGVEALEQGAYAVIEKPIATTRDQYHGFLHAATSMDGARFFLCFHKRHSELHAFAVRDLGLGDGEPVDMHCIVYEIPLPDHHWYNWPNSGSRLLSNGCHWIDYFLHVNSCSPAVEHRVWHPRGSDVSVQLRLENGAYFAMSLTDRGSQRIGVRDHVELRKGGTTVRMVDGSLYEAEDRVRIFRRRKVNPYNAYARMYHHIGRTIATDGEGDSLESLRASELTLVLEEAR